MLEKIEVNAECCKFEEKWIENYFLSIHKDFRLVTLQFATRRTQDTDNDEERVANLRQTKNVAR